MDRGIVAKLKTLLRQGDTDIEAETKGESSEPAGLYECPACETVYVSDDLQSCPECNSAVDQLPNERDLGLTENTGE